MLLSLREVRGLLLFSGLKLHCFSREQVVAVIYLNRVFLHELKLLIQSFELILVVCFLLFGLFEAQRLI